MTHRKINPRLLHLSSYSLSLLTSFVQPPIYNVHLTYLIVDSILSTKIRIPHFTQSHFWGIYSLWAYLRIYFLYFDSNSIRNLVNYIPYNLIIIQTNVEGAFSLSLSSLTALDSSFWVASHLPTTLLCTNLNMKRILRCYLSYLSFI